MTDTVQDEDKGRAFASGVRGKLIMRMLRASNDESTKLPKLSIDITLFLISRGRAKPVRALFYKDLQSLARKVARFSGRKIVPSKGAMSSALKYISMAGLYEYSIDLPAKKDKHGDKPGVRLKLIR
ncbi:hypothetical protein DRW07_15400 [Alteromonas sediminis]|uniref:Uncharacterized protein n=1 Tax=Alteromonas sediminis TaxID=2259342 RepID=A0A3N5YKA7_9ALTE|nr:hypothetical protein [Alteromonas sediminis]RPJ65291.1 hypothetical protein DRW07_15400 [Alteromonas sediminis]